MAQRITNGMMISSYNRNLNSANANMYRFQSQLASGRKMVRLSDDPVNVVKALNAREQLSNVEQYKRNLSDANAWLTQTESALNELNSVIKRVYELSVYASTDTLSQEDRTAIAREVEQLRDQVGTISNTTLGDKYIFGGYNVSKAPFVYDSETGDSFYNGESMIDGDIDWNSSRYEINFSLEFDIALKAGDVFGSGEENNIYYQMNQLFQIIADYSEINADGYTTKHEDIAPFPQIMLDLQKNVLNQISTVGGRIERLELMSNRFENDYINYTQMRSDVEDLDQAEAIMWFSMQEAVYRSSLAVGSKILQPSLMDFMN